MIASLFGKVAGLRYAALSLLSLLAVSTGLAATMFMPIPGNSGMAVTHPAGKPPVVTLVSHALSGWVVQTEHTRIQSTYNVSYSLIRSEVQVGGVKWVQGYWSDFWAAPVRRRESFQRGNAAPIVWSDRTQYTPVIHTTDTPNLSNWTATDAWSGYLDSDDISTATFNGKLGLYGNTVSLTGQAALDAQSAGIRRLPGWFRDQFNEVQFLPSELTVVKTVSIVKTLQQRLQEWSEERPFAYYSSAPFYDTNPPVATLDLIENIAADVQKVQYKFLVGPDSPRTITWLEIFTPSNPALPKEYVSLSWDVPVGATESPIYVIDPIGKDTADANRSRRKPTVAGKYEVVAFTALLGVDANRDGVIRVATIDSSDATNSAAPYIFWVNNDDDAPAAPPTPAQADYLNNVVDGTDDLTDFFPVFLDIKKLLDVLPHTTAGTTYKLKQADGALNFIYTSLTRATAFSYLTDTASTYGPSASQTAAMATTQQITAAGVELSATFLARVKNQNQGVILVECRASGLHPLVLTVEKDGGIVAEVSLHLLPVDIKEVISNQISGSECNKLPTAYFRGEPNNPMLMATRSGVDAHLAVKIDVPSSVESFVYVGIRKIGTQTILGSAQSKALPEKALLRFNAIAGHEIYEVVAGGDLNKNNKLDDSEVRVVFGKTPKTDADGAAATAHLNLLDKIIIVTETQFESFKSSTINNNVWGTDYAGDLISAFGHGTTSVPEATIINSVDIYSTTPGLSHPVGAKWDSSCHDTTYRFTFADGTEASDDFEDSTALAQIIDEVIQENFGILLAQASSTSTVCTPITFSKSKDLLVTEDSIGFNELGVAFGKVPISGSITVTARKTGFNALIVESVAFAGSFDDVYDFAYGSGGRAREASIVQAGHATLAKSPEPNSGKFFFTRLQFSGAKNLNKNFTSP